MAIVAKDIDSSTANAAHFVALNSPLEWFRCISAAFLTSRTLFFIPSSRIWSQRFPLRPVRLGQQRNNDEHETRQCEKLLNTTLQFGS